MTGAPIGVLAVAAGAYASAAAPSSDPPDWDALTEEQRQAYVDFHRNAWNHSRPKAVLRIVEYKWKEVSA